MTTPAGIISRAIKLTEKNGHGRGQYVDPVTHAVCLNGALALACVSFNEAVTLTHPGDISAALRSVGDAGFAAQKLVANTLRERGVDALLSDHGVLVDWNDSECDGAEDAILLLKEALTRAESAEPAG